MAKFLLLLFVIGTLSVTSESAEVTFLRQTHKAAGKTFDQMPLFFQDEIVDSQYAISKFLEKNLNSVVFVESLTESLHFDDIREEFFKNITSQFPDGIPKKIAALTAAQKIIYYDFGGAAVAFSLGLVKSLRATIEYNIGIGIQNTKYRTQLELKTKGYHPAHLNQVSEPLRELVFDVRESHAISEIVKYTNGPEFKNEDNLVLIFGANHDFKKYEKTSPNLKFNVHTPTAIPQTCSELMVEPFISRLSVSGMLFR
jgi:hypothetical protein